MDRQRPGRADVTVRRYASAADAARDDLAYWRSLAPGDRVLMAWRLSEEQWRLGGEWRDEPGLRRSVARLHRR